MISTHRTRTAVAAAAVTALALAPGLTGTVAFAQTAPAVRLAASAATGPTCDGKAATITSSRPVVNGTKRADVIVVTGKGRHKINGLGGNDTICGSTGTDVINGGPGNDAISGNGSADTVNGGPGDDTETGGLGDDTLAGGPGADSLDGNEGTDTYDGGPGADTTYDDGTDQESGGEDASDTHRDDSQYRSASIPAEVRAALNAAGLYLTAGLSSGEVSGDGFQSVLPEVPSMGSSPQSALVTAVMWHSNSKTGSDAEADLCLEATTGDALAFKYRAEVRGDETHSRLSTGRCMNEDSAPQTPADLQSVLAAAGDHMIAAATSGALAPSGDQAVLPDIPGTATPSSPYIKRVVWATLSAKSSDSGNRAGTLFCVAATTDDANWFRAIGIVSGDKSESRVQPGDCQKPSDVPQMSEATGTFLNAARDYMAAGIASGAIAGTGNQAAFPSVTGATAPSGATLVQVRWIASGSPAPAAPDGKSANRPQGNRGPGSGESPLGRFCVAAADAASQATFQVMAQVRADGTVEGRITPGSCAFADEPPAEGGGNAGGGDNGGGSTSAAEALRGIGDYVRGLIEDGDLAAEGTSESLDGLDKDLASVLVRVSWQAAYDPQGEDLMAARFCVSARDDKGNPVQSLSEYSAITGKWVSTPPAPGACQAPPPPPAPGA